MIYIEIISASTLISTIIFFLHNYNIINSEKLSNESRKIHEFSISRYGSFALTSLLILFFYNSDNLVNQILIFSFILGAIGVSEDIMHIISPYIRTIIIFLICAFVIAKYNFILSDLNNDFLEFIFLNYFITSVIFSIFALLILINGFNFIDGMNGLMLGLSIMILSLIYIKSYSQSEVVATLTLCIICAIIPLFIFNIITGKILAGDGSSYFLGAAIGLISIYVAQNNILSPTYIACVLFYPTFEFIFTFFRRIFFKSNPFYPDDKHLHFMIYKLLIDSRYKKYFPSNLWINSFTSILLLSVYSVMMFSLDIISNFVDLNYILFIFLIIYIYIYHLIRKLLFNSKMRSL